MFDIRHLLFFFSILASARASPAVQQIRRQDVCPATVTIPSSQGAASTILVTVSPTTITLITSVCNWTSTSLFAAASTSGEEGPISSTISSAASSASSFSSQSEDAASTRSSSASQNSTASPSILLTSPASITTAPILPTVTIYSTIINGVTVTSTVDEYFTSTIYSASVPTCSTVPTIADSEFDTPFPDSSWAEGSAPGDGFDISTSTNYYYTGLDSAQFSFAAGSTKQDVLSISQVITVCPDQVYDFNIYGTQDSSNTGYCKAWITLDPQVGSKKVGNKVLLGKGNDPVDEWSGIDISMHNAAATSSQITFTISAYCVSGDASAVYLDTATVELE